jgi:hypothetical protein
MIYELREYDVGSGKMGALHARFTDLVLGLFKKYNMQVIGFWTYDVGPSNKLIYMLGFESHAAREKAWNGMGSDPEFIEALGKWAADPAVVARITNWLLTPTAYSPMQ